MQVIFIHHSCFLVEVDEKVLIVDWFAGDRETVIRSADKSRSMSRIPSEKHTGDGTYQK